MSRRRGELLKPFSLAVAAAFTVLAGASVMRSAIASSDVLRPDYGEAAFPAHPLVISETVMAGVGEAAARGETPPPEVLARLEQLAKAQPLAAEPFLVHGAIAIRRGDLRRAELLLVEARARSPRSPAARYLLADLYLRSGRPLPAMAEMSVLNRLLPKASLQLAPALAAYANTPGAERQLGAIVSAYPELAPALLKELASDAEHADLVLALAKLVPPEGRDTGWRGALVDTLVEARQFARAKAAWEQLSGERLPPDGLFNPTFEESDAPPPFNWTLTNDSAGLAGGRSGALEVLYYGRADVDLATQTLLLSPGTYYLMMHATGEIGDPGSLRWTVSCLGGDRRLLDMPLPAGAGIRPVSGEFTVPADCPAQRLQLSASAREFADEAQFRLSGLRLAPAGRP